MPDRPADDAPRPPARCPEPAERSAPGRRAFGASPKPEAAPWTAIDFAAATDAGLVRATNEDRALAQLVSTAGRAILALVVADGVGGEPRGGDASRVAVEAAVQLIAVEAWAHPRRALSDATSAANRAVRSLSEAAGRGPASTLLIGLLDELGRLYLANVGDSRAYVVREGRARAATTDHSTGVRPPSRSRGMDTPRFGGANRTVLTRALGLDDGVQADLYGPFTLRRGEAVLLCTDGLYGALDDVTISRLVADKRADGVVHALIAAANAAGGRDNIAVAFARRSD